MAGALLPDKRLYHFDGEALGHKGECPPTPRTVNMNWLGAALTGEVSDPPILSLYVFNSNPVIIAPDTGRVIQGLMRENLFTVVHELFMTDTALRRYRAARDQPARTRRYA